MSWAALTSGGKDSILSCQKAIDSGKDLRYLVTARPKNRDSYMFHSANLDVVPVIAEVSGREYVEILTEGEKEAELADLEAGLAALDIEGVIAGAVASQYQADRVKAITDTLGLELFTPLWHMDTEELLREVAARMDARIIVTAAEGLDESFLGAKIDDELIRRLKAVEKIRRINLAGEGGEYESITLNAPFYSRSITFTSSEIRSTTDRHELVLGGFA
ncbi:MAG: diphthine--ammonia ligase [Methanoregula sp.]|jgi:ABC transporter with metal-binding/Fe-S-binding domain ATP-binding protein|uniref:diphthine--ammonia ligase n=1 Tax=Methanoregula sp. TaxID=2052170 RepID=UPI0025CD34BC|nr:diphthine--ammonia ligase [Methanoregula sp.]MCK9631288.1 diphthine--ammonia ligase [Methanoregula sp.]